MAGEARVKERILDQTQLAELMGYVRVGDVERRLIEQGIKPIYGKAGHFFITQDMLNASRGLGIDTYFDPEELI